VSVVSQVAGYWAQGALRSLNAFRNGYGAPENDPPAVTPYTVIYEGGKVSLRYYAARGKVRHHTPMLLVYALIKRPFILDLQPGRSVIESLTNQGFDVYFIDWIPPDASDTWRGFDAYVNGDVANAVRAVQIHSGIERINLLGYCFGGLLSLMYTALHQRNIKNLVTMTIPLDMSVRDLPIMNFVDVMDPAMTEIITKLYGNCPAWMMNSWFTAMNPTHHLLDKYVGAYRNSSRENYAETFELFEKWMQSDVPLAGQIFRELSNELSRENKLFRNLMTIGDQLVDLKNVECPLLNMIADFDDVVAPNASKALPELVGSADKRNLNFPTGHIGAAVSAPALKKLWPEIGKWLAERD
jgi:polyhydroxyalkanoate synthase